MVEITYVKTLAQYLLVDTIVSIFLRFPPAPVYITLSSINVVLFILKLIFFFIFFPIMVYCKILEFPVLYSRTLIFMYFIYSSLYLLFPNS